MHGPIRGGGFGSDDDEDASVERHSLSPRSDEDESRRLSPFIGTRFPPTVFTGDDGSTPRSGDELTRGSGGCSPLVQSFQRLSTQGSGQGLPFPPTALAASRASDTSTLSSSHLKSCSTEPRSFSTEPTTPLRSSSKAPLCLSQDFILSDRFAPSSQARPYYGNGSKVPATTESPHKSAQKFVRATPSRKTTSPKSNLFFGGSKRTPMKEWGNSGSRLTVPRDSPRDSRRATPKSLASLPAFANDYNSEAFFPSDGLEFDNFSSQSRAVSPPRSTVNRRLSLGDRNIPELLPSPAPSQSWPGACHSYGDYGILRELGSPLPKMVEPSHLAPLGTPNEPKNMVAPGRPKKKGSLPSRSILNSPLAPALTPHSLDAIPALEPVSRTPDSTSKTRKRRADPEKHASIGFEEGDALGPRTYSSPLNGYQHSPVSKTKAPPPPVDPTPGLSLTQTAAFEKLQRARCRTLTSAMVRHDLKLLCLDWDLTVVALHTKSRWMGTVEMLARWIRPEFRNLISEALLKNIRIAFVSFSGQTSLIEGAVCNAFGANVLRGGNFVVRCSDKRWNNEDYVFAGMFPRAKQKDNSKLPHICSAATYFTDNDKENTNPQTLDIQPHNIVLIDDDRANVKDAREHNVRSIPMDPSNPTKFLDRLEEMCGIHTMPVALHMMDNA